MIYPTPADIGRAVIYRDQRRRVIEEGRITSFNDTYVFVRYQGSTSAATRREDLTWSQRKPGETAISVVTCGGEVLSIDFCEPRPSFELQE